jgi:uncharacterized membrane protein YebE (DUF533 family)
METHADRDGPAMTEPGTLPEGIERLIWQTSVNLADNLLWPKNSNEDHRRLVAIALAAAYADGAAQERARIRAHLGLTYTDREVDDLIPEKAAATRTPPPPEAE